MIFKQEQNRFLFQLFSQIVVLVLLLSSCSKVTSEFASKEDLAEKTVELINKGDVKSLIKMVVQKDDYIDNYYPYLQEAKEKNALSGRDFYGMFIGLQRVNAIQTTSNKYKGRIVKIIELGEPEKIIETETFIILRKIPLKLLVKNKNGQAFEVIDNKLLGAVVEKNNKFRLLNIFR